MQMPTLGRRSILRLLAVGGASLLSAACGGTTQPAASGGGPAATTQPAGAQPAATQPSTSVQAGATPVPGKAAGTTLVYWSFFPSDNTRWAERPTMLAEFTQQNGAKVEVDFVQDAQLDTKVQTGFAAKQLPDLIDPGITQYAIGWGRQGIITDVKDVLVKIGQDDFATSLVTAALLWYGGGRVLAGRMSGGGLVRKCWDPPPGLRYAFPAVARETLNGTLVTSRPSSRISKPYMPRSTMAS